MTTQNVNENFPTTIGLPNKLQKDQPEIRTTKSRTEQ
jgi:hypothetical protein